LSDVNGSHLKRRLSEKHKRIVRKDSSPKSDDTLKQIYSNFKSRYQDGSVLGLRINVEYLGHIKNILESRREEEVDISDNSSVSDLLRVLSEKHGESFKQVIYEAGGKDIKSNFIATVNGYLLNQLNGVETKLKNGDHVVLMPIVSGG
jgi:molybdopterin synthase sulfur carrier subunit